MSCVIRSVTKPGQDWWLVARQSHGKAEQGTGQQDFIEVSRVPLNTAAAAAVTTQ